MILNILINIVITNEKTLDKIIISKKQLLPNTLLGFNSRCYTFKETDFFLYNCIASSIENFSILLLNELAGHIRATVFLTIFRVESLN